MTVTDTTIVTCPACGATAASGDLFCEACGANLPDTGPAPVAPAAGAEEGTAPTAPPPASSDGPACRNCGASADKAVEGYCGDCGMKMPAQRDHMESSHPGVGVVSDRGIRHHRNEDSFAASVADGRVVVLVCDGVSTTVSPDQASQAACDAALAVIVSPDGPADPEARMVAAHSAALAAVLSVPGEPEGEYGWPSCTFLAGDVHDGVADLATLGDCRSMWLPAEGDPEMLTVDDSWAEEKISSGALTMEEAYEHPKAHMITRWLGKDADPEWKPRYRRFVVPGPGRLVLCSDGLWNYALTAAAVGAAAGEGDALTVAQRLTSFANEAGGSDNITVAVIEIDAAPPVTEAPSTESPGVSPEEEEGQQS